MPDEDQPENSEEDITFFFGISERVCEVEGCNNPITADMGGRCPECQD